MSFAAPLPGRVISGGQAGADQAGLVAAARHGIPTGGWMPRGFLVRDGNRDVSRPDLAARFGLREHPSADYAARTARNVADADGTVRFAFDWDAPGERCTLKHLRRLGRSYLDIDARDPIPPERVAAWIREHGIRTLNVAGNVEPKSPTGRAAGITAFVEAYLDRVFKALGHRPIEPRRDDA